MSAQASKPVRGEGAVTPPAPWKEGKTGKIRTKALVLQTKTRF